MGLGNAYILLGLREIARELGIFAEFYRSLEEIDVKSDICLDRDASQCCWFGAPSRTNLGTGSSKLLVHMISLPVNYSARVGPSLSEDNSYQLPPLILEVKV